MIFEEKYFSHYILLTDRLSLCECLYFLWYLVICLLWLIVFQFETSKLLNFTLVFLSSSFLTSSKNSRQKFKYFEKEKSFEDEIKSIIHHFKRNFIEANKTNFFGRLEPDFNKYNTSFEITFVNKEKLINFTTFTSKFTSQFS